MRYFRLLSRLCTVGSGLIVRSTPRLPPTSKTAPARSPPNCAVSSAKIFRSPTRRRRWRNRCAQSSASRFKPARSPDEIKDFFVSKYGEWVLLKPKTTGFSALLWILPYVVLGIGVLPRFGLSAAGRRKSARPILRHATSVSAQPSPQRERCANDFPSAGYRR